MVKISIIIPVKEINDYIRKFVPIILRQSFQNFEIIILPNQKSTEKFKKTRIIPSGNVGPAQKRDLGVSKARGEIIAFIDDDAYPEKDWLKKALLDFSDKEVGMVGGPNLTPKESNFFQHLSGAVLASWIVSGPVYYRYIKSKKRYCDDLPSCNLLIRKKVFLKVRGFDTSFWPGEDTKLCFDVIKNGMKIVYNPEVAVYHHRRPDLKSYLKQIFTYSKYRGFFAKKYPETSLKLSYFIPSIFVLGIMSGLILSFFNLTFKTAYLSLLIIYFLILFLNSLKTKRLSFILPFILTAFLTHLFYGFGFLTGLLKKELRSRYRV